MKSRAYLMGTLQTVANVLVTVAAVLYLALEPRFGAVTIIKRTVQQLELERLAARNWERLRQEGARLGDLDGEIVLVEFADYECPFCRSAHDEVTALLRERSDVTFVFRHFPIDKIHPNAVWGASLSVCAEAVGRFESMHHLLMTTDGWREGAAPNEVAREAGIVDFSEFEACLEAPATLERIKRDSRLGAELGIAGTPTWFGAGGAISGLVDRSTLSGLLQ